ncbi:MAG: hypothetical protein ACO29O_09575, partial [Chitinophagaceae bacterium]
SVNKNHKDISLIISTIDGKKHLFNLSQHQWNFGESELVGPYLLRAAKVNFEKIIPFKTASSFRWLNEKTLEMTIRYIESPHHWTFTLKNEGSSIVMKVINSYEPKIEKEIKGFRS